MNSTLRPTSIDDEAQLIEFLMRVLSAKSGTRFVNPSLLRWKYWTPRHDCREPRSLVIERNSRIVAHAGLWPITLCDASKSERGVQMIDWAADPAAPGAGISLLQRLTKSYDFVYSIGGSAITQSILPKFGFSVVANASVFARPIRPWRQILQHQTKDMRLPLRLARNLWWSKTPAKEPMPEWQAEETNDAPTFPALVREREESFFRYLQQCPSANFLGFRILHKGRKSGFFIISIVGGQARLAGSWLENPDEEHWRITFQLARDAALRCTRACELVARSASEASVIAAARAGMRLRGQTPVFLFRRDGSRNQLPLQFQMLDDDSAFRKSPGEGFLT